MKRHVAWLLSCGLLVGCASTPPPIDEPSARPHSTPPTTQPGSAAAADSTSAGGASTSSTTRAAFHFKSGTLEIGDFDPYALGDNLFDPCTEISPEEFAAAGFENVEPIPEEYAGLARGLSACEIRNAGDLPIADIASNTADRALIGAKADIFSEYTSHVLPTLFTYDFADPSSTSCFAQVDTVRGGLSIGVAGLPGRDTRRSTCGLAIQLMERLFSLS